MRFILELEDEFLDTLDDLAELVLRQPVSTPEEALEVAIFTHLLFQRTLGQEEEASARSFQ